MRLPNLDRLFAESAIADMTNRTIGKRDLAAAYLTHRRRAPAPRRPRCPTTGRASRSTSSSGLLTADEAMRQRTGRVAVERDRAARHPASITQANDEQDVDVTVGALGDALAKGGYTRAVVGNGDGYTVDTDVTTYRRFAVNAMMDSAGTVPAGRVDATLIEPDDAAPFGVQADLDATADAFTRGVDSRSRSCWSRRPTSPASATTRRWRRRRNASACSGTALERSDELVGRLLDEVDPARDAVLVLGTGPSINGDALTIAALRAPSVDARAPAFREHAPQRVRAPRRRRADDPRPHRPARGQGHVGQPVRREDRHARRRGPARAT